MNKIILGDCLENLKKLENESIDLIFADLPFYQDEQEEIKELKLKYKEKKIENYKIWNRKISKECFRVLKNGGNLVLVNAPKYIFDTSCIWLDLFNFRADIPLIRRGSLRPAYMLGFQHNIMLFLVKGDKKLKWNGPTKNHDKSYPTDVWLDIPYQNGYRGKGKNNWHPEAINYPVVERAVLLNSFENDLVLDITMGSGTTGVVCKKNNRNFIGFEINEHYFEIAKKRLELD